MARPKGSKNKAKPAAKPVAKKNARKPFKAPVNTKTGKAETSEPVKGGEVRKVTSGTVLKDLLKTCRGLEADKNEVVGALREKLAYAKDKKGLNTAVFGILRKLDKMEAEKAADWFDTLQAYMDGSGIMAKIEAVQRLPLEASDRGRSEPAEADDEGEGEVVEQKQASPETGPTEAPAVNGKGHGGRKPFVPAGGHVGEAPGGSVVMLPERKATAH